jgi:hypothetical protein
LNNFAAAAQLKMRAVVIVDTSVFMNVLDVPGFNQDREAVLNDLETLIQQKTNNLLLPFATIVEAGNHIAHLAGGGRRREFATAFIAQVKAALAGEAPWTPTQPLEGPELSLLLDRFPNFAMQGIGIADLTIVKDWEDACARHPSYRVRVWSLDDHLSAYDRAGAAI